ncbi:MAG TPA: glycosyltransferase family 4 protein, partial [Ramlibacter sp.]|nr:glycosyltransferase family 4 protein [Ramlibacter sp.]
GVPVVATLHSTKPDAKQELEALALRYGTKRVIAVGAAVAEAYRDRIGSTRMTVLPNPVSEPPKLSKPERAALRARIAGDAARPLLITAGRLAPDKGYADLLNAMDEVRKTHPRALLAIAGIGKLQEELEARIVACGLQEHVRLLGLRNDLPQVLASADLYVSASLREGLPITILEAMAAGLPIVATGVGDVPELLRDARGTLVAPGEPAQLAGAIQRQLDEAASGKRMGATARDYVLSRHSPEAWYGELTKIYAEAAGAPGSQA